MISYTIDDHNNRF